MTQPIAQPEETTNAEVEEVCIPVASCSRAENQELVLSKSQYGTIGTNLCNPHHKNDDENETANPRPLLETSGTTKIHLLPLHLIVTVL